MNGFDLSTISNVYVGSTQYSSIYYGSTLIWPIIPVSRTLPNGYTELQYISSDGTQYIDLGLQLFDTTDLTTIWSKFNLISNVGNAPGVLINTIKQQSPWSGWTICLNNGETNLQFWAGNMENQGTFPTVAKQTIYETPTSGLVIGSPKSGYTHDTTTTLFCNKQVYGSYDRFAVADLYYLKIQKGSNIVADLIPCKNPNNVVGLYDFVSETFYSSDSNSDFIAGPMPQGVKLPVGYTEVEYISSTNNGNQYIDLGIKLYDTLNKDYDIAIKFIISSSNSESQATMFNCQDSNNNPWPGTYIRRNQSNVIGRYIGGTAKDNIIGHLGDIIELPVQTSPNKNVTNLNNNSLTHQYGAGLFCSFSDTNNTPQRYCNGTLYYFKLFVEGSLERDLVPCINPSNVVGMYDLVHSVFYSSPNGSAFVAGPTV